MANQQSTYSTCQHFIPTELNNIIIQDNYPFTKDVSSFVFKPTGLKEKDEQMFNRFISANTVAIFRFKPKKQ